MPVFPCHPGAKQPLTRHGYLDATTQQAQIERWWTMWPTANVALATGRPGFNVLDVDVRPNGSA